MDTKIRLDKQSLKPFYIFTHQVNLQCKDNLEEVHRCKDSLNSFKEPLQVYLLKTSKDNLLHRVNLLCKDNQGVVNNLLCREHLKCKDNSFKGYHQVSHLSNSKHLLKECLRVYLPSNFKDIPNSFNLNKEEVSNLHQEYLLSSFSNLPLVFIQHNMHNNKIFNQDNLLVLPMHPLHLHQVCITPRES